MFIFFPQFRECLNQCRAVCFASTCKVNPNKDPPAEVCSFHYSTQNPRWQVFCFGHLKFTFYLQQQRESAATWISWLAPCKGLLVKNRRKESKLPYQSWKENKCQCSTIEDSQLVQCHVQKQEGKHAGEGIISLLKWHSLYPWSLFAPDVSPQWATASSCHEGLET